MNLPTNELRSNRIQYQVFYRMMGIIFLLTGLIGSTRGQVTPKPVDQKDKQLADRLIRNAVEKSEEDLMASIVRLMSESTRLLEIEFDTGDVIQHKQNTILKKLDEAVKAAAAQRRMKRSKPKQWQGDQRKKPKPGQQIDGQAEKIQSRSSSNSSSDVTGNKGTPTEIDAEGGKLNETRRAWGVLPKRQREEIIQGSSEAFLERYRQWIERYYQALQESDQ